MNTALEYSIRVVQEEGRRCKKSTLNDLVHLTPLRIPLMNPPIFFKIPSSVVVRFYPTSSPHRLQDKKTAKIWMSYSTLAAF